jgi:aryl-alcohol dehydrogenase-like predicted oxidoreductase
MRPLAREDPGKITVERNLFVNFVLRAFAKCICDERVDRAARFIVGTVPVQTIMPALIADEPLRKLLYDVMRRTREILLLCFDELAARIDGGKFILADAPEYPAGLVVATKGGWNRPGPNQWTHDATPAHLQKAVEGSLKRLRLDHIDVYQLHSPDPIVSFEASVETLARLRNEGKIRLIALSNVTQEHIERARKIVPIVSVQNRYSFADREWDYVVDYCERNEIAFIPWFPLGAGKVAGEVLDRIAKTHGRSPTQVALAWLLRRSPIMLPIPGTSSVAHLEENVAAASLRLSREDYEMLSTVPDLVASR